MNSLKPPPSNQKPAIAGFAYLVILERACVIDARPDSLGANLRCEDGNDGGADVLLVDRTDAEHGPRQVADGVMNGPILVYSNCRDRVMAHMIPLVHGPH